MAAARQTPPGARPNRNDVAAQAAGPSGPVIRVGCLRRRVTGVPEEWPSRLRVKCPQALQNPAYRPADMLTRARWEITGPSPISVSYTHLRAHETDSYLVCRLL